MKAPKPTIRNIAELAKVSQSTVSMILNQRSDVSFSRQTVEQVMKAAEQLGYTKSNWPTHRHILLNTIAVICPTITNPYYSDMIQSIEQAANAKGYQQIIYVTYRDLQRESQILNTLHAIHVAGIIFTNQPQNPVKAIEISKTIPTAVISDHTEQISLDTVELNNYMAGCLIAYHILELGHRHIAFISTTLDRYNTARTRRLDGLKDTLRKECPESTILVKEREIAPQTDLDHLHVEHTVGYELTRDCLKDSRLTAFVAVNDMVAYGAADAVLSAGFDIPKDYSICGFDNLLTSHLCPVSLTSVEHHIADKGRSVFEMLYVKMAQNSTISEVITRMEYQPKLIVRKSTGPVRS